MTIYSLGALLSQFWTSPLFHVWFHVLLLSCIQDSQEAGKVVWYSYLFKNFPQSVVTHTVKGFNIVKWSRSRCFSGILFFYDPADAGNLISGSSAFSKFSLYIWKFSVHILLTPSLKDFEHYFASMWNECNCVVVCTFFGIAFLWDWNENWPFPVLWPLLSFPNLLTYWVQHFIIASSLRIWNSWAGIPSPPPAFFVVMLPKTHLTSHSRISGFRWVITPSWLSGS